jgi:hypothetical protein
MLAEEIGPPVKTRYCTGSEKCSCTTSHLLPVFWKTSVQRNYANSCLPVVVSPSNLTVAAAQAISPAHIDAFPRPTLK